MPLPSLQFPAKKSSPISLSVQSLTKANEMRCKWSYFTNLHCWGILCNSFSIPKKPMALSVLSLPGRRSVHPQLKSPRRLSRRGSILTFGRKPSWLAITWMTFIWSKLQPIGSMGRTVYLPTWILWVVFHQLFISPLSVITFMGQPKACQVFFSNAWHLM